MQTSEVGATTRATVFFEALDELARAPVPIDADVPWEGGDNSYAVLGVAPSASSQVIQQLSFDLQAKPGGMQTRERNAWDTLRVSDRRLLVRVKNVNQLVVPVGTALRGTLVLRKPPGHRNGGARFNGVGVGAARKAASPAFINLHSTRPLLSRTEPDHGVPASLTVRASSGFAVAHSE